MTDMTLEMELETPLTEAQLDELLGRKPGRPQILKITVPNYEHDCSRYPEQIRVGFSDGHTQIYELKTNQPHPLIVENIKLIRKMKQGYVNQPERRRKKK